MKNLLYFIICLVITCDFAAVMAQCDPIEYSVFYNSGTYPVPADLQTGDVECYLITPNVGFQVGAIWSNAPIDLQNSFEYSYYVMLGFNDDDGADGIVFVLSGDPDGQAAIGQTGEFLSYGGSNGISPSIALEFDTWNNGAAIDIFNDHAMLHYNGVMDGSAGPAIDLGNIEDGQYHLVQVTWDAVGTNLTIAFDDNVILNQNTDLINDVFGGNSEVLIGFTGSTGGGTNTQVVCDIQVIYTEVCNGVDDDCDGIIDEETSQEFDQEIFICEGEVYTVGSSEYTESGQYSNGFTSSLGCDSIVNTDLTVGEVLTFLDAIDICEGQAYTQGSSIYTVAGTYYDVYENSDGCDSIIQTDLTVNQIFDDENQVSICEGQFHQEGSSVYSSAGTYVDEYTSVFGCDSTVTTVLEVFDIDTLSYFIEICAGETYATSIAAYSSTGAYEEVYIDQNGCDSLIQIDLSVEPVFDTAQSRFICTGGAFEIGSSVYTEAGLYMDTLMALNGCDSVVTTQLGVIDELNVPDSVLCEGQSFTLDMNPFPFHDVQGFTAIANGVYQFTESGEGSVSVDLDGCVLSDDFSIAYIPEYSTEFYEIAFCEDELVSLQGRALELDYVWNTGEVTPTISIDRPGEYIKEYDYQCGTFQDRFKVDQLICNCFVYVPNSFTPDGDLVNDFFGIEYQCNFDFFELSIYDRLGHVVFETNDPDQRWNGGLAGYFVLSGPYQYVLRYSALDTEESIEKRQIGVVHVIR